MLCFNISGNDFQKVKLESYICENFIYYKVMVYVMIEFYLIDGLIIILKDLEMIY